MIYYFAYEGKVYETTLQIVVDGCGTSHLNCVEYDTRAFVTLHPNNVMDGECKFHTPEDRHTAAQEAREQYANSVMR